MSLGERGGTDLLGYLSALRRRKAIIIGVTVVVVGAALALSLTETPIYRAKARLIVEPDRSVLSSNPFAGSSDFVATQMQVIVSQPVQAMVKAQIGSAPKVSVAEVGTTSIVEVSADSPKPAQAAAIANSYVENYLKYRQQQTTDALTAASSEIQKRIDGLQAQINTLSNTLATLPACAATAAGSDPCNQRTTIQQDRDSLLSQQVPLKQQLDQLRVNSSIGPSDTEIVLHAFPSSQPVRPTTIRNGVLAFGVGLLLGVAIAFALEYLDDSIKGMEDFERAGRNLPVLALIPSVHGWRSSEKTRLLSQTDPTSAVAEAYRTLRTSINFLGVDRPVHTIQVTSAGAGEGKTTTAANLAVVLARAGERVIVVSCDLRRPRLHKFFGLPNDIGFTSVLLGEAQLSAALQPVGSVGRLWVLASGPIPMNPSELLSSERASEVLASLRSSADTIVIDCPPVLPVTDASVLATKVDGTLLVVAAGASTNKRVSRAIEMLRQVGAPLIGAVLNQVPEERGYGEHYRYYQADPPARSATADGSNRVTKAVTPPVKAMASRTDRPPPD